MMNGTPHMQRQNTNVIYKLLLFFGAFGGKKEALMNSTKRHSFSFPHNIRRDPPFKPLSTRRRVYNKIDYCFSNYQFTHMLEFERQKKSAPPQLAA